MVGYAAVRRNARAALQQGFHKGLFTVVGGLPPDEHTALLRDPKLARGYTEIPALSTYYIAFNCHHGPMANVAQRRRMCEVISQSAYLGASAGRLLHKAHGLIPPGLLGHDSHREVGLAHALSPHDSPTLQPLSLVALAHPVFQREHAAIMERIVATLERAGIHLEVVHDVSEWRERDNALQSFDLLFTRWFADFIDSHTFTQLLLTTAGYVGPICGSPEIDELIGQGQIAANPQARHRIYTKFEDTLREQARILPLFNEHTYRFIRPEFRGAQLSLGHLMSYDQVELRTGE